jgi:hypothetical protein
MPNNFFAASADLRFSEIKIQSAIWTKLYSDEASFSLSLMSGTFGY